MRAYKDIPIEDTDNNSLNTARLKEVNETVESMQEGLSGLGEV